MPIEVVEKFESRESTAGEITIEQLIMVQKRITEDDDVLDSKTADDESSGEGRGRSPSGHAGSLSTTPAVASLHNPPR